MNDFKKKHNGSYTVEISLIMPVILGVIILCIYLCMYSHDYMVLEYVLVTSVVGNQAEEDYEEIIYEKAEKYLIGKWNMDVTVDEGAESLSVTVDAKMNNSQGLLKKIIGDKEFGVKLNEKLIICNEARWVKLQ